MPIISALMQSHPTEREDTMVTYEQQLSALNVAYLRGHVTESEWKRDAEWLNARIREEREQATAEPAADTTPEAR